MIKEKAIESAKKFRQELKKSIVTAVIAAFSLLIALSWKDLITELVTAVSETSPFKNIFITTIIVTVISVVGILIVSKWGNEKQ